jgi:hypothetical protein
MVNPQKVSEFVMAIPQQKPSFVAHEHSGPRISALDSTHYTLDMLENLRKIASGQGQVVLPHLRELAQAEAKLVLREQALQLQATRFPG